MTNAAAAIIIAAISLMAWTPPALAQSNPKIKVPSRTLGIDKLRNPSKKIKRCPNVDIALSRLQLHVRKIVPGGYRVQISTRPTNIGSRPASQAGWEIRFFNGSHQISKGSVAGSLNNQMKGLLHSSHELARFQNIHSQRSHEFTVHAGEFTADLSAKAVHTRLALPTDGDCNMGNNIVRIRKKDVMRKLQQYRAPVRR